MNNKKHQEKLLISAGEASALLGIGRSLFYSLKAEGLLPTPVRLGSRVLWGKEELQRWVEAGSPNQQCWESIKEKRVVM